MMSILAVLAIIILVYYIVLSLWYSVLLVTSFPQILRKFNEFRYGNVNHLINENRLLPVTVVTPVFNEGRRVLDMIASVVNSDYKNIRHILVNDGSTDDTMKILKKELLLYEIPNTIKQTIKTEKIRQCYKSDRYEHIMVIDKEHSPYNCGADSVNAGLNACQTPFMVTLDADTILEPEALTRIIFAILSSPHCVVVSGSVYVINDNVMKNGKMLTHDLPKHYLTGVQAVEYLRSFLYARAGMNVFGGALCYPGAFTLFETGVLREAQGFDTENHAYDAEITTKVHHFMLKNKYPHRLTHSANAFCWTDVPSTYNSFWKQRNFWQRGMLRAIFKHFAMFFNPRYKMVGMITFPFYVLFEVFGPVIEFTALVMFIICLFLNLISFTFFLWVIVLAWGFIAFFTIAMVFLNQISFNKYNKPGDTLKATLLVTAELFGFRQYRAVCCTLATIQYMINRVRGKPL